MLDSVVEAEFRRTTMPLTGEFFRTHKTAGWPLILETEQR